MIALIIVGIIAWYAIGMLGSAVALGSITKHLDEMFPVLAPNNPRDGYGWLVGYGMAIFGIVNLIGAILFSLMNTHNISTRWEWMK